MLQSRRVDRMMVGGNARFRDMVTAALAPSLSLLLSNAYLVPRCSRHFHDTPLPALSLRHNPAGKLIPVGSALSLWTLRDEGALDPRGRTQAVCRTRGGVSGPSAGCVSGVNGHRAWASQPRHLP